MNIICPNNPPISDGSNLSPSARQLYQWIELYTAQNGLEQPKILSICRSKAHQKQLQDDWDAGKREGLRVRPADNSYHIPDKFGLCHAFDLANTDKWLRMVGSAVVQNVPGARWGGTWIPQDLPHFDMPPGVMFTIRLV